MASRDDSFDRTRSDARRPLMSTSSWLRLPDQRVIPLPIDVELIVGKRRPADVVLDDPYVSQRHARLRVAAQGLFVEDLGSKNGTFVDAVRVEGRVLVSGQAMLRIGRTDLVLDGDNARGSIGGAMLGRSPAFVQMHKELVKAAAANWPVLLRGETGTGKELAARLLHDASARRRGTFVAINCANIQPALAESELFGHVRGAFTGAQRDKPGAFAQARRGTLFLDEIGELPIELQPKLLRVLENKTFTPVGADVEQRTDARVVAATHRPLEAMVRRGTFREDLLHRLSVIIVRVPPLRERIDDVPLLLEAFAEQAGHELGRFVELTEGAIAAACRHSWPGNVRQLRNAVFRASAVADGPIGRELVVPVLADLRGTMVADALPSSGFARASPVRDEATQLGRLVEDHGGTIRKAAEALGIPKSTLHGRLQRAKRNG